MQNHKLKIQIVNAVVVIMTIGLLLFEASFFVSAQNPPATGGEGVVAPEESSSSRCTVYMYRFLSAKQEELAQFINQTFRGGQPTSELIPLATQRLRQYRSDALKELEKFTPEDSHDFKATIDEKRICKQQVDDDYDTAIQLVRQHVVQTARVKKSMMLLTKYKQINNRLGTLNATIAQMAAYFSTFAQQLSCFATKCSKG